MERATISETSYRHSSSEVKLAISMLKQLLNNIPQPAIGRPLESRAKDISIDVE
jgi:hypothetical protein